MNSIDIKYLIKMIENDQCVNFPAFSTPIKSNENQLNLIDKNWGYKSELVVLKFQVWKDLIDIKYLI